MAGYPIITPTSVLSDVALGKTATQSSSSPWSSAVGAAGVIRYPSDEPFGFHTDEEDSPWWCVDLEDYYPVECILVHNRRDCLWEKARTISVCTSLDGDLWTTIHSGLSYFGPGNGSPPLQLSLNGKHWARFIRLQLHEYNYFHLSKVEVLVETRLARVVSLRRKLNIALPIRGEPNSTHPETYEVVAAHPDLISEDLVGIEINENGFFGNSVAQYANAIEFAKQHNLKYIKVARGGLIDLDEPLEIDGLLFLPFSHPLPFEGAFLKGYFFHITPFAGRTIDNRHMVINRVVRRLFTLLPESKKSRPEREVSIHIRSGDIFSSWVHPDYVQPPLSFYQLVIDRLIEKYSVDCVQLVFEDRKNPVVDALERWLRKSSIAYRCQSGTLVEDVSSLLNASHMVYGAGTFGPAVCHLSSRVKTVHHFVPTGGYKFERMSNIDRIFDVFDSGGEYMKVGEWKNTKEQRDLMINYRSDKLSIVEQ